MGLHVELLRWLYTTTGDPSFQVYAQRWQQYLETNHGQISTKIITRP
jgi:hypothetical protein